MLTDTQIQAIADKCQAGGYDFRLALKTAVRDGVPWYRPVNREAVNRRSVRNDYREAA